VKKFLKVKKNLLEKNYFFEMKKFFLKVKKFFKVKKIFLEKNYFFGNEKKFFFLK